ncbi:unnamed protein product [Miscanthus lutarioriparius]|uniref:Uncharacterized protein n=1 Tax=Miscanthus lutarioriparius TaxID=422564 RepID=A0A811ST46_9POAL|nr:unnamed protein product [Miscanthus lutarioriparius]
MDADEQALQAAAAATPAVNGRAELSRLTAAGAHGQALQTAAAAGLWPSSAGESPSGRGLLVPVLLSEKQTSYLFFLRLRSVSRYYGRKYSGYKNLI